LKKRNLSLEEKNTSIRIKRNQIWRLFQFVRLNIKIHEEDPIFRKAKNNYQEKTKFFFSFLFKLAITTRFILLENGKIAGALSLEKKNNSIFVYAVGLLDGYKRKGYGTKLMNFTEDYATKKGRKFVNFSVLLENEPAIKLYEKLGYRSQGLGLTLIRYLLKDKEEIESQIKQTDNEKITFSLITNRNLIIRKAEFWWMKEIEVFAGKEAAQICKQDNLLNFDFKSHWEIYEIFYENTAIGLFAVLPSDLFPTIALFSDPKITWNIKWMDTFIYTLLNSSIDTQTNKKISNHLDSNNSFVIQIFLTHQHKDSLETKDNIVRFFHDQTEDRQIYFKKINIKSLKTNINS